MKRKKLSPELSAEIISELEGGREVAKIFGISEAAVSYLKKTGFTWLQVEYLRSRFPHLASVRKTYDEGKNESISEG